MAIFHCSTKLVSRSKGQSAVAKAAYNARAKLENVQTGERHDYRRKQGLIFAGVFAPKDAPAWAYERETLWAEVERYEKRKDAQLAREIEVALPHELTDQQREWLVKDFVREQFTRRGFVADVVIHAPDRNGDARNHHAHILLPTRPLTPEGFGAKARDLNTKEQLMQWREKWAHLANRHLARHGHAARIDHRTLAAQGLDREPTVHLGPQVAAMQAKGLPTDRGDQAQVIAARNQERAALHRAAAQTAEAQRTVATPLQAPVPEARVVSLQARHDREPAVHVPESPEALRAASPPAAPTLDAVVTGAVHGADQGIMVTGDVAGRAASGLADVVGALLDRVVGPPPPKLRSSDLLKSPQARKAYSAQQRTAARRDAALDRIGEQLKQGPQIEQAAVGALSYSDLQQIKDQGDDGLRALVRQREAELRRAYSFGHTRERIRER